MLPFCLLLVLSIGTVISVYPPLPDGCSLPTIEWNSLYDLYIDLGGNSWTWSSYGSQWNFTDGSCPCIEPWQGINVTETCTINSLVLVKFNLRGSLPSSVCNFTSLISLDLSNNKIVGSISDEIGNLVNISLFDISNNKIGGTLPMSMATLQNLIFLDVGTNSFTGAVDIPMSNWTQMEYLYLDHNKFSQSLSSEVCCLSSLMFLQLQNNKFTNWLPACINNLTQLYSANFVSNYFSGSVPNLDELKSLQYLKLAKNRFTGQFPPSLGNCTNMIFFNASFNFLSGSIPDTIGNLTFMTHFDMSNNYYLTSTLPDSMHHLKKLIFFSVAFSLLTGTLPPSVINCSVLHQYNIVDNFISGTIWENIGVLINTTDIPLENNLLTGTLPKSLSNMPALLWLTVGYNFLSGSVNVFNSSTQPLLSNFNFNNNQFTGTLPGELLGYSTISVMDLSVNCFRGPIPDDICNSKLLNILTMNGLSTATNCRHAMFPSIFGIHTFTLSDYSRVTGSIPSCLFNLQNLQALHISGNDLSGYLSDSITLSPSLKTLVLSHNQISGSVPLAMQQRVWTNLDLSYNKLTKTLLTDFAHQPNNASVSLSLNRLSGDVPLAFRHMLNVSILEGNIYSCDYYGAYPLPLHDSDYDIYQCGSNYFNVMMIIWLSVGICGVIMLVFIWRSAECIAKYPFVLLLRKTIADCMNLYTTVEDPKLQEFTNAGKLLSLFRKRCGIIVIGIVAVHMPIYCAFRSRYSMFTYLYAWTVSAVYFSGQTPAYTFLTLWLFFLFLAILIRQKTEYNASDRVRNKETFILKVSEYTWIDIRGVVLIALFIVVNIAVVGCVNGVFVYISVSYSTMVIVFAQLFLAGFKLIWSRLILYDLTRLKFGGTTLFSKRFSEEHYSWRSMLLICNNVLIPSLATALVDSNCFYTAFNQPTVYSNDLILNGCTAYSCKTDPCICTYHLTFTYTTSFSPPFVYSYQCASSLIVTYIPVFALSLAFDSFLCILRTLLVCYYTSCLSNDQEGDAVPYKSWAGYYKLFVLYDDITKPIWKTNRRVVSADDIMMVTLNYFVVLFTWGVVYPPLAVLVWCSFMLRSYHIQVGLARRLQLCMKSPKCEELLKNINNECEKFPRYVRQSVLPIVFVSSVFYGFVVFDTLGDKVGYRNAFWVAIVLPVTPIVVWYCVAWYQYGLQCECYAKVKPRIMQRNRKSEIELRKSHHEDTLSVDDSMLKSETYSIENPLRG